jgi:hypothetical protein
VRPDAVVVDAKKARDAEKTSKFYAVAGKGGALLVIGALKRLVRWAGKEPEDIDEDEEEFLREGCEEFAREKLGHTNLGPGGKVLVAAGVAGFGMYMGGTPIPKKRALSPAQQQQRQPEADPRFEVLPGGQQGDQ